jgi:hypothetical protein
MQAVDLQTTNLSISPGIIRAAVQSIGQAGLRLCGRFKRGITAPLEGELISNFGPSYSTISFFRL